MTRRLIAVLALLAGSPLDGCAAHAREAVQRPAAVPTHVCPMHPDVRTSAPGTCPRCGMVLVPIDPLGMRDYRLEVQTSPHPAVARGPVHLRLTVRDPDTGEVVREFADVHERRFHLFVISQDMSHYDHLHPQQDAEGAWRIELSLPRPGFYKLFADFLPNGGTPQVIPRPLVTAGFTGDLASAAARLVPDRLLKKTVGALSVELRPGAGGLVAGRDEKLVYRLTDARTGTAVTDVEPYLGAWGHTVIMSEDTLHFVHAHPLELLTEDRGAGGGPGLTFKALLPKPGNYRVWTQIKRAGEVSTVMFTVAVGSPAQR